MPFAPDADGEARPASDGRASALMDGTARVNGLVPLDGGPQPYASIAGHPDPGATDRELIDLRRRLATLPDIEQAKGMLMGCYGLDADGAFSLLRRWSTTRNVKLRTLAADVVAAGTTPHPKPFGALLEHLHFHGLR